MQKRLLALAMPAALATLALTGAARAQVPVGGSGPPAAPDPGAQVPPPVAPGPVAPPAAPYPMAPPYPVGPQADANFVDPSRPREPPRDVPGRAQWGLHNGDTVDEGHSLIYAEFGWPEISTGFQRGVSSYADVGFRVQTIYGVDYVLPKGKNNVTDVALLPPGLGLSVPIRLTVVQTERVSFLAHLDPGFKFDFLFPPFFGPQLPIGFDLGMHLTRRSTLALGVDVPISIRVTPDVTAVIPFLFGLTYEGHVNDRFGLILNARTGVVHAFNRSGGDTDLGLILQGGFVVRASPRIKPARPLDPLGEPSPR
jgi:hypothetical protein